MEIGGHMTVVCVWLERQIENIQNNYAQGCKPFTFLDAVKGRRLRLFNRHRCIYIASRDQVQEH